LAMTMRRTSIAGFRSQDSKPLLRASLSPRARFWARGRMCGMSRLRVWDPRAARSPLRASTAPEGPGSPQPERARTRGRFAYAWRGGAAPASGVAGWGHGLRLRLMHVAVTGASSGIGEAIAREYLARGASVTLVARR